MPAPAIPEATLKLLWQDRRLPDSLLYTIDGRSVTILSPGDANEDGGPDFIDASIRIGGILYRGDVEIHSTASDWLTHTHHTDPHVTEPSFTLSSRATSIRGFSEVQADGSFPSSNFMHGFSRITIGIHAPSSGLRPPFP
jgi:hypothetical protein